MMNKGLFTQRFETLDVRTLLHEICKVTISQRKINEIQNLTQVGIKI